MIKQIIKKDTSLSHNETKSYRGHKMGLHLLNIGDYILFQLEENEICGNNSFSNQYVTVKYFKEDNPDRDFEIKRNRRKLTITRTK